MGVTLLPAFMSSNSDINEQIAAFSQKLKTTAKMVWKQNKDESYYVVLNEFAAFIHDMPHTQLRAHAETIEKAVESHVSLHDYHFLTDANFSTATIADIAYYVSLQPTVLHSVPSERLTEECATAILQLNDRETLLRECYLGPHNLDLVTRIASFWPGAAPATNV